MSDDKWLKARSDIEALFGSRTPSKIEEEEILGIYQRHGLVGPRLDAFAQRLYADLVRSVMSRGGVGAAEMKALDHAHRLLYTTSAEKIVSRRRENEMSPFHFKYMEREYAEKMVAQGQLRLGNFHFYRDVDNLDPEIGDAGEARSRIEDQTVEVNPNDLSDQSWVVQAHRGFFAGLEGAIFLNNSFSLDSDEPNSYMYCLSRRFSESAMREMKYDTAVLIRRIEPFLRAVQRAMHEKGLPVGEGARFGNCRYTGRVRSPADDPMGPAYLKEPRHAHQCEARAFWTPPPGVVIAKSDRPIIEGAEIAVECEIISPSEYDSWTERTK